MKLIEQRLIASIAMDTMNGDSFERNVFVTQVKESIATIKSLRAEVDRLRDALESVLVTALSPDSPDSDEQRCDDCGDISAAALAEQEDG